jgi:hypothetical protein
LVSTNNHRAHERARVALKLKQAQPARVCRAATLVQHAVAQAAQRRRALQALVVQAEETRMVAICGNPSQRRRTYSSTT